MSIKELAKSKTKIKDKGVESLGSSLEKEINPLKLFVQRYAVEHLSFIKNHSDFPKVCSLSSELIASFLNSHIKSERVELVYGTYGKENYYHSWMECDGTILDFTMFQFLVDKERGTFYKNKSARDMMDYILNLQGDVLFERESPLINTLFKKVATISPEFQNLYNDGETYDSYINRVMNSSEYVNFFSSKPQLNSGGDFFDFLKSINKSLFYNRALRGWVLK